MATEGLRRSQRARKPVKSYAVERAEEERVEKPLPPKRKKHVVDDEDSASDSPAPKKRAKKNAKASKSDDGEAKIKSKPAKKSKKKSIASDNEDDDYDAAAIESRSKKSAKNSSSQPKRTTTDNSWHADAAETRIAANNRRIKAVKSGHEEKRLKAYVDDPPKTYQDALKKAKKERMFVLNRERSVEENCHAHHDDCPKEILQIAGSTGNVYKVTISHLPSCTCPVGIFTTKGHEKLCKHAIYVLHNVLKASDELKMQNAFLTSELKEMFSNAPALPSEIPENEPNDGNRKELGTECPICFMDFEDSEETVWCRAACGNNIHKGCFDQWAKSRPHSVTCPFCRSPWEYDDAPKTQKINIAGVTIPEERSKGGYRNVRDQLDYD